MKQISLLVAILGMAMSITAGASEFDGAYVGLNVGNNRSSRDLMPDKNSTYLGAKAGYNLDVGGFLLGAEGFADNHRTSYSGRDAGLDLRFGLPMERWLPYARVGAVATAPGTRVHSGLGIEYKLGNYLSVNAEWATDRKNNAGVNYRNNNFVIGFNILLDAEHSKEMREMRASRAAVDCAGEAAKAQESGRASKGHVYKFFH